MEKNSNNSNSNINNSNKSLIIAVLLILLLLFVIILEQVIDNTHAMAMLLAVIKKSSVYALVAVSMNLLNGFTGLFSLGQAGFMLLGAYTYAIVTIPLSDSDFVYRYYDRAINFSFPESMGSAMGGFGMILGVLIAVILGGLVAAGIAFLIGLPVLRLKSDYLAIATLGFGEIIRAIFQWGKLGPVTNGSNPLKNYVSLNHFQFKLGDFSVNLSTFVAVLLATVCIGIIVMLVNSSYGRAFKAIREDEIAAEAMGINLYKHKQLAFCISSFFAGVGGAMLAMFANLVQANNFKAGMTYELLLIVVLGGIGSISGSCIASFLFILASEWVLRGLDSGTFAGIYLPMVFRNGFRLVIFSVIIMTVVLFFRRGIMGDRELPELAGRIKARLESRKGKAGENNA